jgi:steroid delta-isomerase
MSTAASTPSASEDFSVDETIDLRARVAEYVDAINSRDPGVIADQFTPDAVQADPVTNPPNVGHDAIRAFFEAGVGASDDWRFQAKAVHTCGSHVAIDFEIAVATGGQTMTIDGIEVFAVADDGRFSSAHAYWDEADLSFGPAE